MRRDELEDKLQLKKDRNGLTGCQTSTTWDFPSFSEGFIWKTYPFRIDADWANTFPTRWFWANLMVATYLF